MKKLKINNLILYLIIFILIIIIIISNKNIILNNNTLISKKMDETTQVTDLEKTINNLNTSHSDYANYIQTSKKEISNAINLYSNNNVSETDSFSDFITHIENLTTIPSDTYYYVSGTEGSNNIERYKKINGYYYPCDENGIVLEGSTATDISSKTLIEYTASDTNKLSAGSASFANKSLLLGDGSDNLAYYDRDFTLVLSATLKCINGGTYDYTDEREIVIKRIDGVINVTVDTTKLTANTGNSSWRIIGGQITNITFISFTWN